MTEKKKSTKKEVAETDEGPVKQVKKVKAKELIADEEIETLVSEGIDILDNWGMGYITHCRKC